MPGLCPRRDCTRSGSWSAKSARLNGFGGRKSGTVYFPMFRWDGKCSSTAMMWKISSTSTKASTEKASNAECIHTGLLPKIGGALSGSKRHEFYGTGGQPVKIPLNSRAPSCARQAGWRKEWAVFTNAEKFGGSSITETENRFGKAPTPPRKWWQKNSGLSTKVRLV